MFRFVGLCFGMLVRFFRERRSLLLENLALRQQFVAQKRLHLSLDVEANARCHSRGQIPSYKHAISDPASGNHYSRRL